MQEKIFEVHWILSVGNFYGFAFNKNKNDFLHSCILALKMAFIKLTTKAFMICRKFAKTATV